MCIKKETLAKGSISLRDDLTGPIQITKWLIYSVFTISLSKKESSTCSQQPVLITFQSFFVFFNVKTFSFDLVAFALTDWSRMSPVFKVSLAGNKPLD